MKSNELFSTAKSPRSVELQGPRPPPLRVSKDSHKIRKPPVPPGAVHYQTQPAPSRKPVIIYDVSPKVIHTNPTEFMSLVQRLTGPSPKQSNASSSSAPRVDNSNPFFNSSGAVSPAARYASVERAVNSPKVNRTGLVNAGDDVASLEEFDMGRVLERTGLMPGILSPEPASLQPIPASFFSPTNYSGDPNPLGFLQDNFSPAFLYNNNSLLQSPTPFVSPRIISPAPSMDLFNNFFDL